MGEIGIESEIEIGVSIIHHHHHQYPTVFSFGSVVVDDASWGTFSGRSGNFMERTGTATATGDLVPEWNSIGALLFEIIFDRQS